MGAHHRAEYTKFNQHPILPQFSYYSTEMQRLICVLLLFLLSCYYCGADPTSTVTSKLLWQGGTVGPYIPDLLLFLSLSCLFLLLSFYIKGAFPSTIITKVYGDGSAFEIYDETGNTLLGNGKTSGGLSEFSGQVCGKCTHILTHAIYIHKRIHTRPRFLFFKRTLA